MSYAPRILIIEDEPSVRDFFEGALAQDGYYTTAVASAREGLAAARNREFELVVLDFSLPDGDGIELLKQLRAEIPHLQILATSGFMVADMPALAMAAGASATLAKPTTAHALRNSVYQLLDPSRAWAAGNAG